MTFTATDGDVVEDTRWQPVHAPTGRAPADELVCDCLASTVRVLKRREDDALLFECTGCGGAVFQLSLWEEKVTGSDDLATHDASTRSRTLGGWPRTHLTLQRESAAVARRLELLAALVARVVAALKQVPVDLHVRSLCPRAPHIQRPVVDRPAKEASA